MVRGLDGYFFHYPYLACAVFKLHRASRKIPVVHSERETPLPIPNRAVKPFSADGTWGATPWESRSPPVLHRTDKLSRLRAALCRSKGWCDALSLGGMGGLGWGFRLTLPLERGRAAASEVQRA